MSPYQNIILKNNKCPLYKLINVCTINPMLTINLGAVTLHLADAYPYHQRASQKVHSFAIAFASLLLSSCIFTFDTRAKVRWCEWLHRNTLRHWYPFLKKIIFVSGIAKCFEPNKRSKRSSVLNFLHTTYLKKIRSFIETVAFLVQLVQEIFKTSIFIATTPSN